MNNATKIRKLIAILLLLVRSSFSYYVPFYQRDFAWSDEEVDTLWDDICSALLDRGADEYFLGAVVISPGKDEKSRYVVDGQQRLATMSMIFSAISSEWKKQKDQRRSDGVDRDYLGTEDRRTGDIISKLTLNETNDSVFQSIILRRETSNASERKTWNLSNKKLYSAFSKIKKNLENWLNGFQDKEAALLDIEDFLSDHISVISIEVSDDSDAFVIFETINDREYS